MKNKELTIRAAVTGLQALADAIYYRRRDSRLSGPLVRASNTVLTLDGLDAQARFEQLMWSILADRPGRRLLGLNPGDPFQRSRQGLPYGGRSMLARYDSVVSEEQLWAIYSCLQFIYLDMVDPQPEPAWPVSCPVCVTCGRPL